MFNNDTDPHQYRFITGNKNKIKRHIELFFWNRFGVVYEGHYLS